MPVARFTEIIASSNTSFEDAVAKGIARAVETLQNVEGAGVKDQKVIIKDGKIAEYRVALKVTFILTTDNGAETGASRPVALVLCLRTLLHEPCRRVPT